MKNKNKKGEKMENKTQTCSACFREVKTDGNYIWAHGYRNMDTRTSSCFGARQPSFESSKKGSQEYLLFLRKTQKNLEKVISEQKINRTLKNQDIRRMRSESYEIFCAKQVVLKKLKERKESA
tara:strand:+ start:199 stop:567 length:369 start_codon:yes stop_codon:yes gene_type:complete